MKKLKMSLSILLALVILIGAIAPVSAFAIEKQEDDLSLILEDGSYVPHQVVVLFQDGAIDADDRSDKNDLSAVGAGFGDMMSASSSEDEAYGRADEEITILERSLGDDFVLEDTLVFSEDDMISDDGFAPSGASSDMSDGFTVALVSSDRYDTAALIKKLGSNKQIAAVEPNYITTLESCDYSLDDPLNWYNYQANTPLDHNTAGGDVSDRGIKKESYLSTNAGSAWNKLTGDEEEIVVALIDSGLNVYHEDLKDMLWTNPGDLGIEGEHGFNFQDNASDLDDLIGHGTHCSGIIAAQANNAVGTAGVASKANVKLMMCSTASATNKDDNGTSYREFAAFNYVLKAKQAGVNIVCTSNSWGSPGVSEIYDHVIDLLGEEGILSFFAAGNDNSDLDNISYRPAGGNSPYKVVVGAANIDGSRAGFSNYGRSKVDLFAPGANILSTVGYANYFPGIESDEKRSETSEYFGLFDENTVIENGSAIPSKAGCDDTVKSFGASVFRIQSSADGEQITDSDASCELTVDKEHIFSYSDKPASLRVEIKNASPDEQYYLYFPYQKNPETTGIDNTDFSVYMMRDSSDEYIGASLMFGEMLIEESGRCSLTNDGVSAVIDKTRRGIATHINSHSVNVPLIMSADALGDRTTGIGVKIMPNPSENQETGSVVFYLDSIAVSKPDVTLSADDSYQMMSGTSMATPAAAGAYALLASLYPQQQGQSGAEYALENRARLLSLVRKTDELKDFCVSGGYLDLSMLGEEHPAFTRVECDPKNDTVILSGIHLNGNYTLRYQRRAIEDVSPVALPDGTMTAEFSEDGRSVVIRNAKALFSTYTEFTLSDGDEVVAKICDFIVKGQKKLEKVYEESYPETIDNPYNIIPDRYLLTDMKGENLYGYEPGSGILYKYDGVRFCRYQDTVFDESVLQYFKTLGYTDYDIRHNIELEQDILDMPISTNNKLYQFVTVKYKSSEEINYYEELFFLASMDYTEDRPHWSFKQINSFKVAFKMESFSYLNYVGAGGKVYVFGEGLPRGSDQSELFMYSCNPDTGVWKKEQAPPAPLIKLMICSKDEKLYLALGAYFEDRYQYASTAVYCFDGEEWSKLGDIPYVGDRLKIEIGEGSITIKGACAAVKDGLVFINCPADGGGNTFLFDPDTGEIHPLYYTQTGYKANYSVLYSAVETKDGIYYIEKSNDGNMERLDMYLLPADSGDYTPSYQDVILGDADADGRVTVLDATCIQKKLASMEISSFDERAADVDRDGKVTILDATGIQKFLASMPCPDGIGKPIPVS